MIIDVFSIIYLGYTLLDGPFSKWPPLKNDENNKCLIYLLLKNFCIIIVLSRFRESYKSE